MRGTVHGFSRCENPGQTGICIGLDATEYFPVQLATRRMQ